MKEMIEEYLTDLKWRGYSNNTVRSYRYALNKISKYDVETITADDITRVLSEQTDTATISARQSAIKSFFKWLNQNGLTENNPTDKLRGVRPKETLPKPIPKTDMEKIFIQVKKLELNQRTYFYTLRDLGLRASEGVNLEVEDIQWDKGQEMIRVKGKGNRERIIPLSWDIQCTRHLKRLCEKKKSGPLFVTQQGDKATYDWAYYWWTKLMEDCDMDYTIHQLRHTAITGWVRSGMSLLAVKRLAGHRLLSTTEGYTQVTTDDLRREMHRGRRKDDE